MHTNPLHIAHDDTILADAEPDFSALDRSVEAPVPGAGFDVMLLIDELVDELIDAAEDKIAGEALEISLTITDSESAPRIETQEVAEVA